MKNTERFLQAEQAGRVHPEAAGGAPPRSFELNAPGRDDEVWYACYGSNLSSERFSCYIQGGLCRQNGRSYPGCEDQSLWREDRVKRLPGRMYFGSRSISWGGGGVAFFLPDAEGTAVMRLYKIRFGQLLDVQKQEGNSPNWYGRMACLGTEDGLPVITLTSQSPREQTEPGEAYLELIREALVSECGMTDSDAERYLQSCRRPLCG